MNVAKLVQITEVQARFLMAGEIIERGGHLCEVVGKAIPCPMYLNRSQVVLRDLESDGSRMIPVSLNSFLFVPTYDEIL